MSRPRLALLLAAALLSRPGAIAIRAQQADAIPIRGGERLAWQQDAPSGDEARAYRFRLYIDGALSTIDDVTCEPRDGAPTFECSGRLPAMQPGRHVLELSTVFRRRESRRASIAVVMTPGATTTDEAAAPAPQPAATRLCVSAGECYHVEAAGTAAGPVAAVAASATRVYFVEGGRRLRMLADGRLHPAPSLDARDEATQLVGVAIADDFESTGHVFVGAVDRNRDGSRRFSVTRYRAQSGALTEPSPVVAADVAVPAVDRIPMAFAPTGSLYVALPSTIELAGRPAARFKGGVVRFSPSGRGETWVEQQVAEKTLERPVALVWLPPLGAFVLVDVTSRGDSTALLIPATDAGTMPQGTSGRRSADWARVEILSAAPVRDPGRAAIGMLVATTTGVYRNFGDTRATMERLPFEPLGYIEAVVQERGGALVLFARGPGAAESPLTVFRLTRAPTGPAGGGFAVLETKGSPAADFWRFDGPFIGILTGLPGTVPALPHGTIGSPRSQSGDIQQETYAKTSR